MGPRLRDRSSLLLHDPARPGHMTPAGPGQMPRPGYMTRPGPGRLEPHPRVPGPPVGERSPTKNGARSAVHRPDPTLGLSTAPTRPWGCPPPRPDPGAVHRPDPSLGLSTAPTRPWGCYGEGAVDP